MTSWKDRKQFTQVHDLPMAHVEMGEGDPVVFLHGNPTSSFLWRDVMAAATGAGRLIAPDLIGMGDSDKLSASGPGRYTLAEHATYLDAWLKAVVPDGKLTLVLHDWGGPLGFRWARMHPERVHALPTWKPCCARFPGPSGPMPAVVCSRASGPTLAKS